MGMHMIRHLMFHAPKESDCSGMDGLKKIRKQVDDVSTTTIQDDVMVVYMREREWL